MNCRGKSGPRRSRPPPETFVPVEADNVTLTDDTPEPELTAEQQLEQELAQLKNTGP